MQRLYFMFALLFPFAIANAQLTVNNAASVLAVTPTSQCYQLTPADLYQKGSVFTPSKINLNQNFEVRTQMFFGNFDDGADGIAFVLQRESPNYIGNYGAAMGYARFNGATPSQPVDVPGPVPSFIVEFDTWQNGEIFGLDVADPVADHIAFMSQSDMYHSGIAQLQAPVSLSSNIEDGQWHDAIFNWDAASKTMTVTFTVMNLPNTVQVVQYTGDIVNTIFGGDPMVYWGFTASTGSIIGNQHAVCILPPPPPEDCSPGHTQTPGGWGAPPNGNNPGAYLHANFASAFPNGLTIGKVANNKYAKFTTATAITNYLPAGGPAKALTTSYINPATNSLKNVLANHLVALTLSVGFDVSDPNFSSSGTVLGDMIISSSKFKDWKVSDFLKTANNILGGDASSFKIDDLVETATMINENYVDGKVDKGYLLCPGISRRDGKITVSADQLTLIAESVNILPNPSRGHFNVRLNGTGKGSAQVRLLNSNGVVIESRMVQQSGTLQNVNFDVSGKSPGMYLVQIIANGRTSTHKVIVTK